MERKGKCFRIKNCGIQKGVDRYMENTSFLKIVDELMSQGLSEEAACREAYAITHPDSYEPEDYDCE